MRRKQKYTLEIRAKIIGEKAGVIQEDVALCTINDVYRLSDGRYEPVDEEQRMDIDHLYRIMDDIGVGSRNITTHK